MFSLTCLFLCFSLQILQEPKCEQSPKREILILHSGRYGTPWKRKHAMPTLKSPRPPYPWGLHPMWKELLRNNWDWDLGGLSPTTKASPKMARTWLELAESCKVLGGTIGVGASPRLAPWRPARKEGFSIFSQLAMFDYRIISGAQPQLIQ